MDFGAPVFTNLISYFSLMVSGGLAVFYVRDRRHAKYKIEMDYSNQLLNWHASVVDVLLKLSSHAKNGCEEEKPALLIQLSSLIEQGRFYFPNISPGKYGVDKPPAYRGYRNIALDFLVASYNIHSKPYAESAGEHADYLRRLFTSVVFEIVRPSERLATIRDLTDKYFVKDLSVEYLESQEQIDAVMHMWKGSSDHMQSFMQKR